MQISLDCNIINKLKNKKKIVGSLRLDSYVIYYKLSNDWMAMIFRETKIGNKVHALKIAFNNNKINPIFIYEQKIGFD